MRILIIEDEKDIVRFLELELQHEGYETECAYNGRDGLDLALEREYGIILLDVMLPGLNGIEVLRRLRQVKPVPVILLTARDAVMDKVSKAHVSQSCSPIIAALWIFNEVHNHIRSGPRQALVYRGPFL